MKLEIKGWAKQLQKEYSRFEFHVGVLQDRPEPYPRYGETKNFHGGKALKKGKYSATTVAEVAETTNRVYNWLLGAWSGRKANSNNAAILRVLRTYAAYLSKPENNNRLRNAVQAVVRNPILRGDYGSNSESYAKQKGFNRFLIATGTLFDSIKAAVVRRGK